MDTGIYRTAMAQIRLMDGTHDIGIFLLICVCDLRGPVFGTVIDHKDLNFISSW